MYWPVGTPRIYAASIGRPSDSLHSISRDGLPGPVRTGEQGSAGSSFLSPTSPAVAVAVAQDALAPPPTPITPATPATPASPLTPAVQSVEYGDQYTSLLDPTGGPFSPVLPPQEPILALQIARSGHLFAVITSTSINIWQTKVCVCSPS